LEPPERCGLCRCERPDHLSELEAEVARLQLALGFDEESCCDEPTIRIYSDADRQGVRQRRALNAYPARTLEGRVGRNRETHPATL
jgi:hypothetical protein